MIRTLVFMMVAGPALAQEVPVPSGLSVTFAEVILEPDLGFARFRFLAPDLGQPGWGIEEIAADFTWLCDAVAVPALAAAGWEAAQIIVSIADRPLAFGEADADAVQFFEGYSVSGDACQWEPF